jgi:hypothetical protein
MNLDKTFCMQSHQIELCKTCSRNFRLLSFESLDKPVELTTFTPTIVPKQYCKGYIHEKQN